MGFESENPISRVHFILNLALSLNFIIQITIYYCYFSACPIIADAEKQNIDPERTKLNSTDIRFSSIRVNDFVNPSLSTLYRMNKNIILIWKHNKNSVITNAIVIIQPKLCITCFELGLLPLITLLEVLLQKHCDFLHVNILLVNYRSNLFEKVGSSL